MNILHRRYHDMKKSSTNIDHIIDHPHKQGTSKVDQAMEAEISRLSRFLLLRNLLVDVSYFLSIPSHSPTKCEVSKIGVRFLFVQMNLLHKSSQIYQTLPENFGFVKIFRHPGVEKAYG